MARCLPALVEEEPLNKNDEDELSYLQVIIGDDCPFDSDKLFTIDCKQFSKPMSQMTLDEGVYLKDLCRPFIYYTNSLHEPLHPIKNPWQAKADGKVIRHVPITLYSDNTSGNVSKKWNKHISLYFTLSGLPPDQSNQEFNLHYLATSNSASALDLLDEVVDDINDLAQNGCVVYNHMLGAKVLAMVVVLCHLGDSPMHAEITNTLNPANTLTPYRVCDLKVDRAKDKQTAQYVRDFVRVDELGNKSLLPGRQWLTTNVRTCELWKMAERPHTKTHHDDLACCYGLRDTVNEYFYQKVLKAHEKRKPHEVVELLNQLNSDVGNHLFSPMLRLKGFDGHKDTPVEILHVVLLGITKYLFRDTMKGMGVTKPGSKKYDDLSGRWRSFNTKGLNVPPIQPHTFINFYQSLVGKEFRTVLQTVPFVLFKHLPEEKRHVWTSLCLLASYVFQTKIQDMNQYLKELDMVIDSFLKQLISLNARWVNKPKFHMLVHLQESIRRFGPACLFATEKFESFNGVLRNALVNSDHLAPGRDIGNTFNTGQMLRIFCSALTFFDHDLQERVLPGPLLCQLLTTVPELNKTLGLNPNRDKEKQVVVSRAVEDPVEPPLFLPRPPPNKPYK